MTAQMRDPRARAIVSWMQAHPDRLRDMLDEGAQDCGGFAPASDAAIRAHLRFVTEALADTAGGGRCEQLEAVADELPAELAAPRDLMETLELVGEAAAQELCLQFGAPAAKDPALHDMVERRLRIGAWQRVFLRALEDALGPDAIDIDATLAWMADRHTILADTILAMDRGAKQAEISRGGPDAVADRAVVNRIAQAASLQAHTRFLVDALAATLPLDG